MSLPHLNLTNIAWETLKSSGLSTTYGFECLLHLETVDRLTTDIINKNEELFDFLRGVKERGQQNEALIKHLQLLVGFEKSLADIFEKSEEKMENCSQK